MKKFIALTVTILLAACLIAGCSTPQEAPAAESATTAAEPAAEPSAETETPAAEPETTSADDNTPAETGEGYRIGIVSCDAGHPGLTKVHNGMYAAARDTDEIILTDAALDQAKQIADMEDLITRGIDIIAVDAVDSAGIRAGVEACVAADVPCISYNTLVDDSYRDLLTGEVSVDNYDIGYQSGIALAEALGGEGNVAMYCYSLVVVCRDRADGFKAAMEEYPGINIIVEEDGINTPEAAIEVMENWMKAYPDMDAVWANNMQPGFGIIAAVEGAGKSGDILISACLDGLENELESMQKGTLTCGGLVPAYEVGVEAMDMIHRILDEGPEAAGENPLLKGVAVNKDNMEEEYAKALK